MEIKPHYVTFEQAKLLKEKGFDLKLFTYYKRTGFLFNQSPNYEQNPNNWNGSSYIDCYSAPEYWQVIEWLLIVHNIWIDVSYDFIVFDITIVHPDREPIYLLSTVGGATTYLFTTLEEAYSGAFDYILNNLI